jgi:hypothetical protein
VRVLRALAGVVIAGGFLLGTATPGWAEEPRLDVDRALDVLAHQQVYRAPGAVAHLDESRVLPALDAHTRILLAPYSGALGKDGDYADDDAYTAQVRDPLDDWATKHKLELVFVEGIQVSLLGALHTGVGPSSIPELRQVTAYLDVSEPVIFAARYGAGVDRDEVGDFDYPHATPVPPSAAQVDDLAARLRDDPVYNAPGRDDPVDPRVAQLARQKYGLTVRIAAFPVREAGDPIVDYGPELLKRFPGEVILVAQGRWLDVAADEQAKAESARDYAYGRYEYASFTQGSPMQDRVGTVLERLHALLKNTAYGRPQPAPQPRAQVFDVRQSISDLTPWVLVGAALVLGTAGLYTWRRGQAERADTERRAMRRERASAMAKIGELGARLLAVEERGEALDPAAAERHATARTLYDQALTAKAMVAVAAVAEEGLEVVGR